MTTGTVETYTVAGGTGRIRTDDGDVLFVHGDDIEGDHMTLEHGDRVEFRIAVVDGVRKAIDVRRL
ncbi:MAG: cold shock domain-containing protein [Planctomycetota bacterium]